MDFFEEALPVEAAPEAGALPPDAELKALPHDEQNASPSLTEAPQWGAEHVRSLSFQLSVA